jgi:hypothetical protein
MEAACVPGPRLTSVQGTETNSVACDSRSLPIFLPTQQPAAFADRDNPARVNILLQRTLTSCGPADTVPLLLRGSDLKTALPRQLTHAPVGAEDIAHSS